MITHRHTTKWIALVMAVSVCLCLAAVACFGITERQRENSTSRKVWRWGTEVAVLSPEAAVRI